MRGFRRGAEMQGEHGDDKELKPAVAIDVVAGEPDLVDEPESVRDATAPELESARRWHSHVYLPALAAMRWSGCAGVIGSMRRFGVHVGSSAHELRESMGLSRDDRWTLIPVGNLGLAPLTPKQAAGRRSSLYSAVSNARARSLLSTPVEGCMQGPVDPHEQAIIAVNMPDEKLRAAARLFAQPCGLSEGGGGEVSVVDLRTPPPTPSYVNRKGNTVPLHITVHARRRFALRTGLLAATEAPPLDLDWAIAQRIGMASRVENLDRQEKTRLRRYGGDTLFLRCGALTFVVRNGAVITVEISGSGLRHLNKFVPPPLTLSKPKK